MTRLVLQGIALALPFLLSFAPWWCCCPCFCLLLLTGAAAVPSGAAASSSAAASAVPDPIAEDRTELAQMIDLLNIQVGI